jgi:hypothetical protein
MNRPTPKLLRRRSLVALGHAIHVTWPVLSAIIAIQLALGLLTSFVEGWRAQVCLWPQSGDPENVCSHAAIEGKADVTVGASQNHENASFTRSIAACER